jgi:hypothetical protein
MVQIFLLHRNPFYTELLDELPTLENSHSLFHFGVQGDAGELLYFLLSRIRNRDTLLMRDPQTVNPVQQHLEGRIIKIIQCVQ